MKFPPKYRTKKLRMIYTIFWSFCSFLNWEGAHIRPQIRPRKIPVANPSFGQENKSNSKPLVFDPCLYLIYLLHNAVFVYCPRNSDSVFVKRRQPAKIATYYSLCAGYFDKLVYSSEFGQCPGNVCQLLQNLEKSLSEYYGHLIAVPLLSGLKPIINSLIYCLPIPRRWFFLTWEGREKCNWTT